MTTENKKIGPIQAYKIIYRNRDRIPQPEYIKWVMKYSFVLALPASIMLTILFAYYPNIDIIYLILLVGAIIWPISFFIGYKHNLYLIKVNNFE